MGVTLRNGSIVAVATVIQNENTSSVVQRVQTDVGQVIGGFELQEVPTTTTTTTTSEACSSDVDSDLFVQTGQTLFGQSENDQLGRSIDFSQDGTRIAIGVPQVSGNGQVEIYDYDGGSWNRVKTIYGEGLGSSFGTALALNDAGTKVVVGAPTHDYTGTDVGRVSVYQLKGGVWVSLGQPLYGEASHQGFGSNVGMSASGDRIIASAWALSISVPGFAKVYEHNGTAWNQLGQTFTGLDAKFSSSIASDGNRIITGEPWLKKQGLYLGRVKVYDYNLGTWSQVGQDLFGEDGDSFGNTVDISRDGSIISVSSPHSDRGQEEGLLGHDYSGHVTVFHFNGSDWIRLGEDIPGRQGFNMAGIYSAKLSSDGDRIVVGSPYYSVSRTDFDTNKEAKGHIRIFDWDGSAWNQAVEITGSCRLDFANYAAISSDGSKIAIGSTQSEALSGSVRIFTDTSKITTTTRTETTVRASRSSKSKLNTGEYVAIAAGSVAGLIIVIVVAVNFEKIKKWWDRNQMFGYMGIDSSS